jgi:hypothetical protein
LFGGKLHKFHFFFAGARFVVVKLLAVGWFVKVIDIMNTAKKGFVGFGFGGLYVGIKFVNGYLLAAGLEREL